MLQCNCKKNLCRCSKKSALNVEYLLYYLDAWPACTHIADMLHEQELLLKTDSRVLFLFLNMKQQWK